MRDFTDIYIFGLWMLANISFAGMRAQNSAHNHWRIIAFVFGLPGTLISYFAVKEGGERAYGITLPKTSERFLIEGVTESDKKSDRNEGFDGVFSWLVSGLFCLFCFWAYVSIHREMRSFMLLLGHISVNLPLSTKLVIASWPGLYLCIFGGAIAFVIIKEFLVTDKKRSLTMTLIVAVFILFIVYWTNTTVLLPFIQIVDKLLL